MNNPRSLRTLEAIAILLFLIQAVRVLFAVLFGLIYDTIFAETLAFSTLIAIVCCVIAAFLTPLATPHRLYRVLSFATVLVATLARIPLTMNTPTVRLWSSILIVGMAGIYITILLRQYPRIFSTALLVAFAADQFLRTAGSTFDVSLRSWWLPVQVALSLVLFFVAWMTFSGPQDESPAGGGIRIASGLAFGALLFIETSLLNFPNALARWSGTRYALVTPLLMATTLLAALIPTRQKRASLPWVMVCVASTLGGLALGRIYGGIVGLAGFLIAQFLLLFTIPLKLVETRPQERTGLALALGFITFLLLNFALAFTFTYPYTIPTFRGMGLPVVLIAACLSWLPILRSIPNTALAQRTKPARCYWPIAALVVLLAIVFSWPVAIDRKESGPIRVATYNMHYGYNTPWQLSLEEQARTIEKSGADIVMLQEVDAGRITSYGIDDALWLARRLGMEHVYGPALENLSGIALLTRFPITQADTQLLTSQLEQTAIVHARVQVGDRPLDAYGIWMGLQADERARQLDDALSIIGTISPAVFGGDFNATPDSPTYTHIRAAGFSDPFLVGGFEPLPTSPAIDPVERIDFVWAKGLDVQDAQVLDSLASDHRMVVVQLALPQE